MRQLLAACAVLTALGLASLATFAQTGGQAAFDPKDLSGYWLRSTVRPRNAPPLTPAGVEAMKGRIPNPKVRVPSETNDPMYACNPDEHLPAHGRERHLVFGMARAVLGGDRSDLRADERGGRLQPPDARPGGDGEVAGLLN